MKRLFLRSAMLALALWLIAPAPAAWAAATLHIQNPNVKDPNDPTIYKEWPSSAIVTKTISIHFEAYSEPSGLAWQEVKFIGRAEETIVRDPSPPNEPSSVKGTKSQPLQHGLVWNTTDPGEWNRGHNGTFTIQYLAKEHVPDSPNCSTGYNCVIRKFKVNNPPSAVGWISGPTASMEGGRPVVSISWSYAGNEPDMREFAIFRDGGSTPIAYQTFQGPGTYRFEDKSYADSGYEGSHSYKVVALRSSPVGSNYKCSDRSLCTYSDSGGKSVTLTEPRETTGSTPGGTPPTEGTSGGGNFGSNPGFRPAPAGTVIVGGRRITRPGCEDCKEFFEGEYSTSLPYPNDRSLLIPTRPSAGGQGNRIEALQDENSAPLGVPIRDRSVLLPFAGGLLLFLAAAHVRRLLRKI